MERESILYSFVIDCFVGFLILCEQLHNESRLRFHSHCILLSFKLLKNILGSWKTSTNSTQSAKCSTRSNFICIELCRLGGLPEGDVDKISPERCGQPLTFNFKNNFVAKLPQIILTFTTRKAQRDQNQCFRL